MFILCMIVLLDVIMFSSKVFIPTYYEICNLRYCFVSTGQSPFITKNVILTVLIFNDCYSRVGILIATISYISLSQRFCMMYFTPQLFILYNLIISRNSSIAVMVVLLSHFMYMSNVWKLFCL